MCCCLLTSRIKHGNDLAATQLWIDELSVLLRSITTARGAAVSVLRAVVAVADSWQGCQPGWIRRLCGCLLVSEYGLSSLSLLCCCRGVATAEAVSWLLTNLSCLVVCNAGLWTMCVALGQAVVDVWHPEMQLRRDCLDVVLRVMNDDLEASPDAASLAVAELLPLLYVQCAKLEGLSVSESVDVLDGSALLDTESPPSLSSSSSAAAAPPQSPALHPSLSRAISSLCHPMIFKSVLSPVQRLASYSDSRLLGPVCPHAAPSVAGILSAARPWLHVHASISLASRLSEACEKITAASGTNSSALLTSAAILCTFLERHKDATALLHMAVRAAQEAEAESQEAAAAAAAVAASADSNTSTSAAATLLNAFDSNFSSAGIVSSSWLMRLLGASYLRQGRITCAYHTLYDVTQAAVRWCLSRDRSELCTPNPMIPGMSKTAMVAAEGDAHSTTQLQTLNKTLNPKP